ncbi:basic proline-rich protein-like [Lontra canadensis]|uniref:basic proline-rich protein-like n=1 Tax=Lontra canadensis TaxID=76717 RepID=UPI0013F2B7DC|nr:basic proline-rich protein-like [Lontra canadensis]
MSLPSLLGFTWGSAHTGSQHGLPSPVWPLATGPWKITDSEGPRPTAKQARRVPLSSPTPAFPQEPRARRSETTTRRPPAPPPRRQSARSLPARRAPAPGRAPAPPSRSHRTRPARARRLQADPPHPRPLQGRVPSHAPPTASRGGGARKPRPAPSRAHPAQRPAAGLGKAAPLGPPSRSPAPRGSRRKRAAGRARGTGSARKPTGRPGPFPPRGRPGPFPPRGRPGPTTAALAGEGARRARPRSPRPGIRGTARGPRPVATSRRGAVTGTSARRGPAQTGTRSTEALGDRAAPCPQEGRRPPRRSAETRRAGLRGRRRQVSPKEPAGREAGAGPPRPAAPRLPPHALPLAPAGRGRRVSERRNAGSPGSLWPPGHLPPSRTRKTRSAAGRASPGATGRGCGAAARAPGASARAGGARSRRSSENRGRPGTPLRSLKPWWVPAAVGSARQWRLGVSSLFPWSPACAVQRRPLHPGGQADVLPSRPARKPRPPQPRERGHVAGPGCARTCPFTGKAHGATRLCSPEKPPPPTPNLDQHPAPPGGPADGPGPREGCKPHAAGRAFSQQLATGFWQKAAASREPSMPQERGCSGTGAPAGAEDPGALSGRSGRTHNPADEVSLRGRASSQEDSSSGSHTTASGRLGKIRQSVSQQGSGQDGPRPSNSSPMAGATPPNASGRLPLTARSPPGWRCAVPTRGALLQVLCGAVGGACIGHAEAQGTILLCCGHLLSSTAHRNGLPSRDLGDSAPRDSRVPKRR